MPMIKITPPVVASVGLLMAIAATARASTELRLDQSAGVASAAAQQPGTPAPAGGTAAPATDTQLSTPTLRFGDPGRWWLSVGAGISSDFDDAIDVPVTVSAFTFVAPRLEAGLELGGWYFDQPGDSTGGVSLSGVFRYHFLQADDRDWTLFAEARIGILAGFDNVPSNGTEFNFLPGIGAGFTRRLFEDSDARLLMGVRWHHISNANTRGSDRNPGRDAAMLYGAIVFPLD